jgi:serine phosphatase RsbU (regulator of sigma subunit)
MNDRPMPTVVPPLPANALDAQGSLLPPERIPIAALMDLNQVIDFAESVAELTQTEAAAIAYHPRRPRRLVRGRPMEFVRAPICRLLHTVQGKRYSQCLCDIHEAGLAAMQEERPVTADCIGASNLLYACPILLAYNGATYPKAAVVAAAHDIFSFHFADQLSRLTGHPVVELEEMMVQTDKRALNASQLRLLRTIIEVQTHSFSRQISDRYAQLASLATILTQGRELSHAYEMLDGECRLVGRIQRHLVPSEPPTFRGYRIAAHYVPAQRAGGDYYDFFPQDDGSFGLVIADVSGHGPGAAVIMAMLRAILRTYPHSLQPVENVLQYANEHISANTMADQFVTAFFGVLSPSGQLEAACAGHNSPLVYKAATRKVHRVAVEPGFPLGVAGEVSLGHVVFSLDPGDVLVLYTDGVTDTVAPGDAPFGLKRLAMLTRLQAHLGAQGLRDRIFEELTLHSAGHPLVDDQTLIVIERTSA